MKFPTGHQPSEIVQPGEQPFHFPPASIPSQHPTILGFGLFTVALMWCDKLGSILLKKALIQRIAIVRFITNDSLWRSFDKAALDGAFNQLHFVG